MLERFESKVFAGKTLSNMNRPCKFELVVFALNVSPKERLPAVHPSLRFTTPLAEYCALRYKKMGSRLAKYVYQEKGDLFGYFSLVGKKVRRDQGGAQQCRDPS